MMLEYTLGEEIMIIIMFLFMIYCGFLFTKNIAEPTYDHTEDDT